MNAWNKGLKGYRANTKRPEHSKWMLRHAPMRGKKFSSEHKAKLRLAHLGYKMPNKQRDKIALANRGERAYQWIKDRTKVKRYWTARDNVEYRRWRLAVCRRDGFECVVSNQQCNGSIVAHHISAWSAYPELRYVVGNGITLCRFHHPHTRHDESRLASMFLALLAQQKR